MADPFTSILEEFAPRIADGFGAKAEDLIDPAVRIDVDYQYADVEILERMEAVAGISTWIPEGEGAAEFSLSASPPEGRPIFAIVVIHGREREGGKPFWLPDPRQEPDSWPWNGKPDDDEG